jgi:MFS family permease
MMAGLFLASVISGQLIAHWGRYKPFPIVGTALMALSLFLLSRMDEATDVATSSGYLLVLGIGIGLVMQVLVLAVQNAVEYRDVGVATSGAGFFRSIGGSFGVAILGAVFSNLFDGCVADLAPGTSTGDIVRALSDPLAAGQLPAGLQPQLIHAFASSLDAVFLVAVPLALAAFLLTLFLPEIPLRRAEGPSQPNTELQKAS